MRCFICLEEKPGTVEHVFPLAIGGSLTTDRLCIDCNSLLGSTADTALIKHPLVAVQRARHGLAGNSGRVPDGVRVLIGNAVVDDGSGQRVRVSTRRDGVVDARLVHHEEEVTDAQGNRIRRVSLDARDAHLLSRIIGRERKRSGMPPLSPDHLAEEVARVISARQTLDGPRLRGELVIDLENYRAGLLKIVYELACLWFGDAFIDGDVAAKMREVLTGRRAFSSSALRGSVQLGGLPALRWWRDSAKHVAFALEASGRATISVQIFDAMSATVVVGDAAVLPCGRFIELDAIEHSHREADLRSELRIVTHRLKKACLMGSTSLASLDIIGRATLAAPLVVRTQR